MSFKEFISTGVQYGKDIFSPEIYLSECERILNTKNEFNCNLTEDEVLEINSELATFFTQNFENPTVIQLQKKYNEFKAIAKMKREKQVQDCSCGKGDDCGFNNLVEHFDCCVIDNMNEFIKEYRKKFFEF